MKLDEAIRHSEKIAENLNEKATMLFEAQCIKESRECIECSKEHHQLAVWLKELKVYKENSSVQPVARIANVKNFDKEQFKKIAQKGIAGILPQQPQQNVIYSGDGYYDGQLVYDMANCPNCDYEYEEDDKDWGLPYCPNCGTALIWEVENGGGT